MTANQRPRYIYSELKLLNGLSPKVRASVDAIKRTLDVTVIDVHPLDPVAESLRRARVIRHRAELRALAALEATVARPKPKPPRRAVRRSDGHTPLFPTDKDTER